MEVSTVLVNLLDQKSPDMITDGIKRVIAEAFDNLGGSGGPRLDSGGREHGSGVERKSYASVVDSSRSRIFVSRGPPVDIPCSTSFFVVPDEKISGKFTSSRDTKDALFKALKPSKCSLKVNRITFAAKNGIRIEANAPDLERIRSTPELARAGLRVLESVKSNPRIIVHGVPTEMTPSEVEEELMAQNLHGIQDVNIKFIYRFPPKQNKLSSSCVLEISPTARCALLKSGRIYLRYATCTFADHIRILQCYRCLAFGHMAKDCKAEPSCGHCSGAHEMKNCSRRSDPPRCGNCLRLRNPHTDNTAHSATDAGKCPVLGQKIKDKITFINYG